MKEDLFNWYKKGFDNLPPTEPPPMVWENIASALDGKPKRRIPAFWWWSGLSILVVGLATAVWLNYSPTSNVANAKPESFSTQTKRPQTVMKHTAPSKQKESSNSIQSKTVNSDNPLRETNPNQASTEQVATANNTSFSTQKASLTSHSPEILVSTPSNPENNLENTNAPVNSLNSNSLAEETNLSITQKTETILTHSSGLILPKRSFIGFELSTINPELTTTTQQLPELIIPKMNNSGSSWFFGVASEINNNWVFNHDLVDAMRKESMNSILPHFSSTHSLVASKEFLPNHRIRAELILSKKEGQHYVTYHNGQLLKKDLHLNYSGATLLYDYRNPSPKNLFGFTLRTHWLGGASLCYLSESKLAIGQTMISPSGYRKMNISLVAGMEKEVFFTRQLSLGAGLRLMGGLTNIFKGYENIPAWFNRTHTGNIAGTLSVRYYLNIPNH